MTPDFVMAAVLLIVAAFGFGYTAGRNKERAVLRKNAKRVLELLDEQRRG